MTEEIQRQILAYIRELSQISTELNQQITKERNSSRHEKTIKKTLFSEIAKGFGIPVALGKAAAETQSGSQVAYSPEIAFMQNRFVCTLGAIKVFLGRVTIEKKNKRYAGGDRISGVLDAEINGAPLKYQIHGTIKLLRKLARSNLEYTDKPGELPTLSKEYVFDSQIFDRVLDGRINFDTLMRAKEGGCRYYISHIQIDEINNCPDADRRARLFLLVQQIGSDVIPTESTVLGISRFGQSKLGDGGVFRKIEGANQNHLNDGLIGEIAIKTNKTLVSDDKRLKTKVKQLNGRVLSSQEFLDEITKLGR